jgi:hypothetical protein
MSNPIDDMYKLYLEHHRSNYSGEDRERVAFMHGMLCCAAVLNKDLCALTTNYEDDEVIVGDLIEMLLDEQMLSS